MAVTNPSHHPEPTVGQNAFAEVASVSKNLLSEMLVRMIESAAEYHNWDLSDEDAVRMSKLLKHKQRIICSSFAFQQNRHFAEFKSIDGNQGKEVGLHDWQRTGPSGANEDAEIAELESITTRYNAAFGEFDRCILKRLQTCIRRSRASIYDNPLQVKRLCESFRYAINGLSLPTSQKLALYRLFADRFIDSLGPLYRRIDQLLIDHGMLPELAAARIHLRSAEGLSESKPALKLNQSACLLFLLQQF